jgi:hypothetical protein
MTNQVGYMSSWSAYNMYRKQHPQQPDPLLEFRQQVMDALEAQVSYGTSVLSFISSENGPCAVPGLADSKRGMGRMKPYDAMSGLTSSHRKDVSARYRGAFVHAGSVFNRDPHSRTHTYSAVPGNTP